MNRQKIAIADYHSPAYRDFFLFFKETYVYFFLFCLFLLPVSTFSQENKTVLYTRVNLKIQASREDVLKAINSNYSIHFFYQSNLPGLQDPVSVEFTNLKLEEALRKLLSGTPVEYIEISGQIILKEADHIVSPDSSSNFYKKTELTKPAADTLEFTLISKRKNTEEAVSTKKGFCPSCFFRFLAEKQIEGTDSISSDTIIKRKFSGKNYPAAILGFRQMPTITFWASPSLTFRTLTPVSDPGREIKGARNEAEKPGGGINAGLTVSLPVFSVLHFNTGLTFLSTNVKGSFNKINYASGQLETQNYKNSYSFLLIPFELGKSHLRKNWALSFNTGLAAAILLRHKSTYGEYDYFYNPPPATSLTSAPTANYNDPYQNPWDYGWYDSTYHRSHTSSSQTTVAQTQTSGPSDPTGSPKPVSYNKIGLVYTVGLAGEVRVYRNMFFYLAPSFKCFLTSVYKKTAPVKEKPWSIAIETGVRFRLY
jgi:hypothetical protein